MSKNNGFTLIEILVALLIFAIMGVLAAKSLQAMIRSHRALEATNTELIQLNLTMALLRRDISQIIDRSVMDGAGGKDPAFSDSSNGIIFTRTGLINPMGIAERSDMQRIDYAFRENALVRLTWSVLDQPPKAEPETQVLLKNIASIEWQFLGKNNQTSPSWPPAMQKNSAGKSVAPQDLPRAVLMVLHMENGAVIPGVFPVPARGVLNASNQ